MSSAAEFEICRRKLGGGLKVARCRACVRSSCSVVVNHLLSYDNV